MVHRDQLCVALPEAGSPVKLNIDNKKDLDLCCAVKRNTEPGTNSSQPHSQKYGFM